MIPTALAAGWLWLPVLALVTSAAGLSLAGSRGETVSGHRGNAPVQSMQIEIRGAVARVSVSRQWSCGSATGQVASGQTDAVLDIALPARAELLDVSLGDGGHLQPTRPLPLPKARDGYLEALRTLGLSAREVAFDDEARYRIRSACTTKLVNNTNILNYSFSILLEVLEDRARLSFPAAAELSPPPTEVAVRVIGSAGLDEISIAGAIHSLRPGAAPAAVETVSTRSPWVVSLGPVRAAAGSPSSRSRIVALTSSASLPGKSSLLGYAIGARAGARQKLPERALFLIDRSRSVGPGGLEAEREIARRVLEGMPPATRFDALFFDRVQRRLFPMVRSATREAMTLLEDEMVPGRLANGTDLAGALQAAGDLLRREPGELGPQCLLVLLTDGAIGQTEIGAAGLFALLGPPPGVELMIASVSVRSSDDPEVSPGGRRALRGLAAGAPRGGVERSLRTPDIADGVPALLEALRLGGDVFEISFGAGAGAAAGAGGGGGGGGGAGVVPGDPLEVLPIGAGISGVLPRLAPPVPRGPGPPRSLTYRGLPKPHPLQSVPAPAGWLEPLLAPRSPAARLLVAPGIAALVEPVIRVAGTAPDLAGGSFRAAGFMERSVVRDALSLAFTPRARACYLNRSARTAAERDLTGRVRLALDLERGEVAGVRVESSTLGHPAIESCLRDSAFAIEVPRAYRNDESVTAVLNLVFRPRTPERHAPELQSPGISREIDLLIEGALKKE